MFYGLTVLIILHNCAAVFKSAAPTPVAAVFPCDDLIYLGTMSIWSFPVSKSLNPAIYVGWVFNAGFSAFMANPLIGFPL